MLRYKIQAANIFAQRN